MKKTCLICAGILILIATYAITFEIFSPEENVRASSYYVTANTHRTMQNVVYVSESGSTDVYYMKLTGQPTADVRVTLTEMAGYNDLGFSPSTLTFTSANWDTEQTITVSAIDDSYIESYNDRSIWNTCATTDPNYIPCEHAGIVVTITDNDTAGLTITGSPAVTEGGTTGDYTVALQGQSRYVDQRDATVNISSTSQVTVSPTTLTFTAANWTTPQHVTVTAVNDLIANGTRTATITHAVTSTFPSYNGLSIPLSVSVADNDTAGVTLTQTGGVTNVTEGGATATYTAVLLSQPTANVVITPVFDSKITVALASLTFTSANWNTPQTFTVTAVDDAVIEGTHSSTITHTATSSDTTYNSISIGSITATITDNDFAVPGVTLTASGGATTVTEGGATDTYGVVLNAQPSSNVVITATPDGQVTVVPSTLTFTNSNWATPQTITVTAVNDSDAEGTHAGIIAHSAASSDGGYNEISIGNITVTVTDNDSPGVSIAETGSSTAVTEGGATDTYTIVLTTRPHNKVTITPTPNSQLQVSPPPPAIEFTTANWQTPRTITITAVDDSAVEGPHAGTITHSAASTDSSYNNISINSITVSITDNDSAPGTPPPATPPPPASPPPATPPGGGGGGGGDAGGNPSQKIVKPLKGSALENGSSTLPLGAGGLINGSSTDQIKIVFSDIGTKDNVSPKDAISIYRIVNLMVTQKTYKTPSSKYPTNFKPNLKTTYDFAIRIALTIAGKDCGKTSCYDAAVKENLIAAKGYPVTAKDASRKPITRVEFYDLLLKASRLPLVTETSSVCQDTAKKDIDAISTYNQTIATWDYNKILTKSRRVLNAKVVNKCQPTINLSQKDAAVLASKILDVMSKNISN